ncbi:unnamed protein product [Pylaiella littoralis]
MEDPPYFQAPALQVLWQAVTSDPMDFQSWTALLSQVESIGSPEEAQHAYDEFLQQFPLCFGYWTKYANLVSRQQRLVPPAARATGGGGTAQRGTPSSCSTTGVGSGSGVNGGEDGWGGGAEPVLPSETRWRGGAREVFERAVVAAPFCLELWEAFARGVLGEGSGEEGCLVVDSSSSGGGVRCKAEEGGTRRVLERALEAVGDHPKAGALWRKCVAFEEAQGGQHSSLRVTRLYERAFGHRLEDLEMLWVDFKEFSEKTPWDKLKPPSAAAGGGEISTCAANVNALLTAAAAAAAALSSCVSSLSFLIKPAQATVGCKAADAVVEVVASAERGSKDADKKAMLVKILEGKRKASLRGRQRRESFERRISRPHFHVKPLDDAQLSAWSQYLDFELAQAAGAGAAKTTATSSSGRSAAAPTRTGRKRPRVGEGGDSGESDGGSGDGNGEIERLFERCLVPCASYWWLWERYALWKESIWGLESALEVAQRACSPFLRWRPEALFFQAEVLERLGRSDEARGVYQKVLSEVAPGLVEGACKLACFERRCGNREAAAAAYRSLLPPPLGLSGGRGEGGTGNDAGSWSHWEETTETTRPYLYMQLARFQHRVAGDPGSARTTFRAAVADIPGSRELWLAFLEFEAVQPQALHAGRVEAAFRMAVEEPGYGDGGRAGAGNAAFKANVNKNSCDDDDDARRLTVEDRADLWEWFEEFVEDLSMDVAKVMSVRAEHKAWTRAHGTGAHEAAAATAAAAAAAASAAAAFGDSLIQASQTTNDRSGSNNITNDGSRNKESLTIAVASRTVAPPANPHLGQPLPSGAAVEIVGAASTAAAAAAAAAAGARGRLGWAGGVAAVGEGGATGISFAPPADQQRREMWQTYQHQHQQQTLQQNMSVASPLPSAGARTVSGTAAQASAVGPGFLPSAAPRILTATWDDFVPGSISASPELANVISRRAGAPEFSLQQQQHPQHQQQIVSQMQNQQEMHQRIYAGSYPLPTQQQQQQQQRQEQEQDGQQGWLG